MKLLRNPIRLVPSLFLLAIAIGTLLLSLPIATADGTRASFLTALFTATSLGERPDELALVAPRTAGELTWPCGACLQVALELGGPDLVVHTADPDGAQDRAMLAELLPRGPLGRSAQGRTA